MITFLKQTYLFGYNTVIFVNKKIYKICFKIIGSIGEQGYKWKIRYEVLISEPGVMDT